MNKEVSKYQRRMFENVYDVIKVCSLSEKQIDDYAIMSRQHAKEAKQELGKFLRYKNIEWDGTRNVIKLGKYFSMKLIIN